MSKSTEIKGKGIKREKPLDTFENVLKRYKTAKAELNSNFRALLITQNWVYNESLGGEKEYRAILLRIGDECLQMEVAKAFQRITELAVQTIDEEIGHCEVKITGYNDAIEEVKKIKFFNDRNGILNSDLVTVVKDEAIFKDELKQSDEYTHKELCDLSKKSDEEMDKEWSLEKEDFSTESVTIHEIVESLLYKNISDV